MTIDRTGTRRSRTRRRSLAVGLVLATVATVATVAAASDATEALTASIDVERALLIEDVERHERLVAERARIQVRLQNLYATLDAALRNEEPDPVQLDEVLAQVEAAERERNDTVEAQRRLVRGAIERARTIRALEARMGVLEAREDSVAGPLAGRWTVTLLPTGQRGVFHIEQNGVLVSGTYTLEGGWSGSLQGTLVNRKLYLVRIDSKLGRSMEFEGFLAAEGDVIRGTWLNYDLGAEGGAEGEWSARRVDD